MVKRSSGIHMICSLSALIFPFSVKEAIRKVFFDVCCSNHQNKEAEHTLLLVVKNNASPTSHHDLE